MKNTVDRKRQWVRQFRKETGRDTPEKDDEPELLTPAIWAWQAFDFLSRQRQVGANGPQPISPTDLFHYCLMAGITTERRQDFLLRIIPELDSIYLNDFYTKQEKRVEKMRRDAQNQSSRKARR